MYAIRSYYGSCCSWLFYPYKERFYSVIKYRVRHSERREESFRPHPGEKSQGSLPPGRDDKETGWDDKGTGPDGMWPNWDSPTPNRDNVGASRVGMKHFQLA